jgi:hypothetical protein
MHSVNNAIRTAGCFAHQLPNSRFFRLPVQCRQTQPLASSCSGPDAGDGLSLVRNGCASQRLHSGVNVPGLPLPIPSGFCAARSAFRLCYPDRFAPIPAASSPSARCRSSTGRFQPCLPPPLPFGIFCSLWIRVFNCSPTGWSACRIRPISSRSPLPSSIKIAGCGSSFQVRYVSGGLLFLKPLGTSFTMLVIPVTVK